MPDFKFSKVKPGQAVQALDFNRLSDDVEAMIAHIAEHFLVNPNTLDNTKGVVLWGCGLTDTSGGGALKVTVGAGAMLLPGNAGANTDLGRTAEEGNPDTRINGNGFRLAILSQTELTLDAHGGTDRTDTIQVELDHEGFGPEDDAGLTESRNVRSVDGDGNQQVDAVAVATQRRTLGKAVVYKSSSASETGKGELATVAVAAGGITITDARRHLWGNASLRGLAALVQQFDSVVGLRGAEDNGRFIGGLRVSTPIEDSGPNVAWANSGTPTATFARRLIGLGSIFGKLAVGLKGVTESAAIALTAAADDLVEFVKADESLTQIQARAAYLSERLFFRERSGTSTLGPSMAWISGSGYFAFNRDGDSLTDRADGNFERVSFPPTAGEAATERTYVDRDTLVRAWVRIKVTSNGGGNATVETTARGPAVQRAGESRSLTVAHSLSDNWHILTVSNFINIDLRHAGLVASVSTAGTGGSLGDGDDADDFAARGTVTIYKVTETSLGLAPHFAARTVRGTDGNAATLYLTGNAQTIDIGPGDTRLTDLVGPLGHDFEDTDQGVPSSYVVTLLVLGVG